MAPLLAPGYATTDAQFQRALADLNSHFWDDGAGHARNTYDGFTDLNVANAAGASDAVRLAVQGYDYHVPVMWEHAAYMLVLTDYVKATGDSNIAQMIQSDWNYSRQVYQKRGYPQSVMTDCTHWFVNSEDDAGWVALWYLGVYDTVGAGDALANAKDLVRCSYSYFGGSDHGLMYSRALNDTSTSYETGLMTAAWEIYKITGDTSFRDFALQSYAWMQRDLSREDGLYWNEYSISQQVPVYVATQTPATGTPNLLKPGHSVSYLTANMAMAVMNARLYQEFSDPAYLDLAVKSANGIATKLVTPEMVLVDDKDGWANGTFAPRFAQEVATLPGVQNQVRQAIFATAASIVQNARTGDGYYLADWDGAPTWQQMGRSPDHGGMAMPEQIMTSSNSVDMVLAGRLLSDQTGAAHPRVHGSSAQGFLPVAAAITSTPVPVTIAASFTAPMTPPPLGAAPVASTSPPPPAFGLRGRGWIVAYHSGKCVDLTDWSINNGTRIQQWDCISGGQDNQQWEFWRNGDGYFRIISGFSHKCLDVRDYATGNGAAIQDWECAASAQDNQLFSLVRQGDAYRIVGKQSGKCIDVINNRIGNGVRLQQWDCNGTDNQLFRTPASL